MNYNVILFVDSSMMGGIETHLLELSKLLTKNNISNSILFYKDHSNDAFYKLLDNDNVNYEFLTGNISSLLSKVNTNTVLHTHGYKAGIIGRLVSKIKGIHCVSTYHAGERGEGRVKLYNYIDKLLSPLSTNFAVSNEIGNKIHSAELLENFISINEPLAKKQQFGSIVRVGFVGRLSHEKGPDIFTQVAKAMANNTKVEFHIFGDGPLKNELPTLPNLNFHGLTKRDQIWHQIDVLLISSRAEGLPMTLLEAMANHIIVVSTPVGAIPNVISNESNGYLADAPTAKCCEDALTHLIHSSVAKQQSILQKAYTLVEARFSGEKQIKQILAAYKH